MLLYLIIELFLILFFIYRIIDYKKTRNKIEYNHMISEFLQIMNEKHDKDMNQWIQEEIRIKEIKEINYLKSQFLKIMNKKHDRDIIKYTKEKTRIYEVIKRVIRAKILSNLYGIKFIPAKEDKNKSKNIWIEYWNKHLGKITTYSVHKNFIGSYIFKQIIYSSNNFNFIVY